MPFDNTSAGTKPLPSSVIVSATASGSQVSKIEIVCADACRTALVIASCAMRSRWCFVDEDRLAEEPETLSSTRGVPGLINVYREGNVAIANAPGIAIKLFWSMPTFCSNGSRLMFWICVHL